jgi:hypothetical protein
MRPFSLSFLRLSHLLPSAVIALASYTSGCGTEAPRTGAALIADAGGADVQSPVKDADVAIAWCSALGSKMDRCDGKRECGAKFSEWCSTQSSTNSKTFEQADAICLAESCDVKLRSQCRYRVYGTPGLGLTSAQVALVKSYCASCSPGDVRCETALTAYSPATGTNVSDAFVAAWEFSDALTDAITLKCTGAALKSDAGSCEKAFASCATDVYLDALPNCP